jgi:hypothetical protein
LKRIQRDNVKKNTMDIPQGTSRSAHALCIAALSLLILNAFCYGIEPNNVDDFVNHLSSLQNLQVEYHLTVHEAPLKLTTRPIVIRGKQLDYHETTKDVLCHFSCLRGSVIIEIHPISASTVPTSQESSVPGPVKVNLVDITKVFSDERWELLNRGTLSLPSGVISDHDRFYDDDAYIDIGLGLRLFSGATLLREEDLRNKLTVRKGAVDHQAVFELEDTHSFKHRWEVDESDGFKVESYTVTGRKSTVPFVIYNFGDFLRVKGVWLPKSIEALRQYPGSNSPSRSNPPRIWETAKLTVANYVIDSPDNVIEKYRMVWPKGTIVWDQRTGLQIQVRSGDRVLSDSDIFEIQKRHDTATTKPITDDK